MGDVFEHDEELGLFVHGKTGQCLTMTGNRVHSWDCQSSPNQRWAADPRTGAIVTQANHYAGNAGGFCITRVDGAAEVILGGVREANADSTRSRTISSMVDNITISVLL